MPGDDLDVILAAAVLTRLERPDVVEWQAYRLRLGRPAGADVLALQCEEVAARIWQVRFDSRGVADGNQLAIAR